jgi:hypothetical protein
VMKKLDETKFEARKAKKGENNQWKNCLKAF